MKIGRMRYRIDVQEFSISKNANGFPVKTWNTVCSIWADVVPVSGKELLNSGQIISEVTHKIYIRYRDGINTDMRVKHEDKYYNIISVLGDRRSGMLTLMVKIVE